MVDPKWVGFVGHEIVLVRDDVKLIESPLVETGDESFPNSG